MEPGMGMVEAGTRGYSPGEVEGSQAKGLRWAAISAWLSLLEETGGERSEEQVLKAGVLRPAREGEGEEGETDWLFASPPKAWVTGGKEEAYWSSSAAWVMWAGESGRVGQELTEYVEW